ncbi:hypothetical protein BGX33_002746 [Mortierella sp. NVP41]|nr:hypothetical protein BGX33_002746 [Mortierella sp. NVP41]
MSMAYLERATSSVSESKPDIGSSTEDKVEDDGGSDSDEADKDGGEGSGGGSNGEAGDENEPEDGENNDDEAKVSLLRSVADVLFFDDTSLYDYRFSETPEAAESQKTRSKFVQEFSIDWLAQRPERLIHLGSIFGTGRVAIESLEAKAWLQMIRNLLIIRTETLQTTSQRIADKINGSVGGESKSDSESESRGAFNPMEAGFVGIHIRMSDGHFSLSARDTIESIRQELMWQVGILDPTVTESDHASTGAADSSSSSSSSRSKKQKRLSIE